MSIDVLRDDFTTPGALTTPPYTSAVVGSSFVSDGIKVYPGVVGGAECMQTLVQAFTLSTAGTVVAEYELDVIMPTVWPASAGQSWVGGMALVMPAGVRTGLTFTLKRATTGPVSTYQLHIRGNLASADLLLTSGGVAAFVPDQLYRITAQITFNTTFLGVVLLIDGTLVYLGSISLAQWNGVTALGTTNFQNAAKLMGLFTDIDGAPSITNRGYLDRLRLRDQGSGTTSPDPSPEYTLTAAPDLTPISLVAENPATVLSLTVHPDYTAAPDDQWGSTSTTYDSGHVQSLATQTKRRTRWPMSWSNRNQADRDTLMALHAATTGRVTSFDWTEPETATTHRLRFVGPMQCSMVSRGGDAGGRIWTLRSEVEEVLSA
jgi:hypothetical protein